jgi:hypothetical protein
MKFLIVAMLFTFSTAYADEWLHFQCRGGGEMKTLVNSGRTQHTIHFLNRFAQDQFNPPPAGQCRLINYYSGFPQAGIFEWTSGNPRGYAVRLEMSNKVSDRVNFYGPGTPKVTKYILRRIFEPHLFELCVKFGELKSNITVDGRSYYKGYVVKKRAENGRCN